MALTIHYTALHSSGLKTFGGSASIISNMPQQLSPAGSWKNRMYNGYSKLSGTPNGYLHGGSYVLPMTPGNMSSYVNAQCEITPAAILYMGRNLEGVATATITLVNADLDQIIALVASAVLQLAVNNASLSAAVDMAGTQALALTIANAQLGGIFSVSATGTLTITENVIISALAFMEAEAGGPTELSPEGLAIAVWNYLQSNETVDASMKQAVETTLRNAKLIPASI